MKPCRKCGATDRNKSGDCRPCQKVNQKIRALKPCSECGVTDREASGRCRPCHRVYDIEHTAERVVYLKERREASVNFKIRCNLRSRLSAAIKNGQKSGSAVRDLGCTIEELRTYLEAKFEPGMSWNNWSLKGWHIDHIQPLASFDLTDREQFLVACHYTNLQPLWAEDNLHKGDKR